MENRTITVEADVHAPLEKVWEYYTSDEHVTKWNQASDDWHSPSASNDLRVGGTFSYRMESKDGSEGFDFNGIYEEVEQHSFMKYKMDDGRRVEVTFNTIDEHTTHVKVVFEMEDENPEEMQRAGWQAILDNFQKYAETH